MKYRVISAVLALLCIWSVLTACGADIVTDTADTTENTSIVEAETELTGYRADYLPNEDYEGYKYRLVQYSEMPIEISEQVGSIIDDSIYERDRKVEERFNVRFTAQDYLYTNYPEVKKLFDNAALSSSDDFDLACLTMRDAYQTVLDGYAPPASNLPIIDLAQPWYIQSVNDSLTIGGVTLLSYSALETRPGGQSVVFNRKIFSDLGFEDPYDLVDNGTWTLDVFYKMCMDGILDVDGNGKYEVGDRFGIITEWDRISMVAYLGTGNLLVDIEDGVPVASQKETLFDVFLKCQEYTVCPGFMLDTFKKFGTAESSRGEGQNLFKQGGSVFIVTPVSSMTSFGDMNDDFGLVVMPKLDEKQDRYYTSSSSGAIGLPLSCSENLERVCVIKEALACESLNIVTPAFYDNALKNRYLRDERSVEMLEIITASGVIDLGQAFWWDIIRTPWQDTLASGKDKFASAVSANMKRSQKAIDTLMEAIEVMKNG